MSRWIQQSNSVCTTSGSRTSCPARLRHFELLLGSKYFLLNPISYQSNTDDLQLYFSIKPDHRVAAPTSFLPWCNHKNCVFLSFWLRPFSLPLKSLLNQPLYAPLSNSIKPSETNLDIIFDQNLNFHQHIRKFTQICFPNSDILPELNLCSLLELSQWSFILSFFPHLYNSIIIFSSMSSSSLLLWVIWNTAARTYNTSHKSHNTWILAMLHWLPMKIRTDFRILITTYKAVNNSAPLNIVDLLWSTDQSLLTAPQLSTKPGDMVPSLLELHPSVTGWSQLNLQSLLIGSKSS